MKFVGESINKVTKRTVDMKYGEMGYLQSNGILVMKVYEHVISILNPRYIWSVATNLDVKPVTKKLIFEYDPADYQDTPNN